MKTSPVASWLDVLWEAVCVRATRPIPSILLDKGSVGTVARQVFEDFLEGGGEAAPKLQIMMSVLTAPVRGAALAHVAHVRKESGDQNLLRDPSRKVWEENPDITALVQRDADGKLVDAGWSVAEPVMWRRVGPVYRKLRLNDTDARDVYAETIADFLKARANTAQCPFRNMLVFEEVPRLFAVVAERRAISWLRKQTTLKNQPNQAVVSLDDPDSGVMNQIAEPASLAVDDPLSNARYDQIKQRCGDVLNDFEWHVVEILFVEANQTRDELVLDDQVLEQLDVKADASRSTKLRRLNACIADALARLGKCLEEADL